MNIPYKNKKLFENMKSYENKKLFENMKSELISSEGLSRVYELNLDANSFSNLINEFYKEKQKTYTTKYFNRPGKVPMSIVENDFKNAAFGHVGGKMVNEFINKIEERFLGEPDIKVKQTFDKEDLTKNVTIIVTLSMHPSVPEINFESIKISNPSVEITNEDIQKEMENWAKSNEKAVELSEKRNSQMGDTIDVSMSLLGQSDNQNFRLKLGSGKFIPEIEDKLAGLNEGDKIQHEIVVPKNVSDKGLPSDMKKFAGKKLSVNFKINKIMGTQNHEVDIEMAKEFGCSSIEACKEKFKLMLEKRLNESVFMYKKHQLSKQFSDTLDFELPANAIQVEKLSFWNKLMNRFGIQRKEMFSYPEIKELFGKIQEAGFMKNNTFEDIDSQYEDLSKRRLKFFFVMKKIQSDSDISLIKSDVDAEIMKRSENFKGGLAEAVSFFEKNKNAKNELENSVIEDKIVQEILSKVNLTNEKMNLKEFFDVMNELVKSLDIQIDHGNSEVSKDENSDASSAKKVKSANASSENSKTNSSEEKNSSESSSK